MMWWKKMFIKRRDIRTAKTLKKKVYNVICEQAGENEGHVVHWTGCGRWNFLLRHRRTLPALVCYHNENGFNEVGIKTLGGNLSVDLTVRWRSLHKHLAHRSCWKSIRGKSGNEVEILFYQLHYCPEFIEEHRLFASHSSSPGFAIQHCKDPFHISSFLYAYLNVALLARSLAMTRSAGKITLLILATDIFSTELRRNLHPLYLTSDIWHLTSTSDFPTSDLSLSLPSAYLCTPWSSI